MTKIKKQPKSGGARKAPPNVQVRRKTANTSKIPKAISTRAVNSICGLTDPFCGHARGAKYPDDSSARTLPFTYHGRVNLGSDTNGTLRYLWYPQFGFNPITWSSAATGSAVTAWTDFAPTSVVAGVESYRIVSSGFKVKSIIAPLNASGEVNVRTWATQPSLLANADILSYNNTDSCDRPTRLVDELAVVSAHNAQMPQIFYLAADDAAAVGGVRPNGFNASTIYASGLPVSSICFVLEWVVHYELLFADASGLSQLATPPPPANSVITQVANRVTSQVPSIFERGAKMVGDMIVKKAVAGVATYLGGPAGGGIAMQLLDG